MTERLTDRSTERTVETRVVSLDDVYDADDQRYDDAMHALRETIARFDRNTSAEQDALAQQYDDLLGMADKLEQGHLHIVIYGQISAGKSALINALLGRTVAQVNVRGGTTTEAARHAWETTPYRVPGFASSEVFLIDTPGISEIDGAERGRIAQQAAQRADLILFVTDGDLVDAEFQAISSLATARKPMILVFNKIDLQSRKNRAAIHQILQERVRGIIAPEDVVQAAADPKEIEVVRQRADGTEVTELRQPAPDVAALKERMLAIFEREGKVLIALNSALFASDRSDQLIATRLQLREGPSNQVIVRFAVMKGVAVGANPIPLADVAGGVAVDAAMVIALASMYGFHLTRKNALSLVGSIVQSAGAVTVVEYATHLIANAINVSTLFVGVVATAIPQAVIAAFGSYVVGHAAKEYFKHGSWGEGGPKAVVERILREMDKRSVMSMLKEQIERELQVNAYANRPSPNARA